MILLDSSLTAFLDAYNSEEACLQAIFHAKWPRGFCCPNCGHDDGKRIRTRRCVQCTLCKRQTSITANTVFQDSRVPLRKWFLTIYLVAHDKGGVSASRLAIQLGVKRDTATLLLRKIRFAMGTRDKNLTLAGYIELDEAFLGGRSKNKRLGKSPFDGKVQVLVMVESENMAAGNLVMKVIPNNTLESLRAVISEKVESDPPGQRFRADGLGRHHAVRMLGHRINMSVMSKSELNTQMACLSLAVSHVKRFFKGTYHHFCRLRVQEYLDEFCYRWNRRHFEKTLANHLITACVLHPTVTANFTKRLRAAA